MTSALGDSSVLWLLEESQDKEIVSANPIPIIFHIWSFIEKAVNKQKEAADGPLQNHVKLEYCD